MNTAYMKKLASDVVVVGGGPAGMLASAIAAQRGLKVILLEQNDVLGKKLAITGKGRCNITNDCSAIEVISNIPTGGRFLHSALSLFSPADVMAFFSSIGVPLKTERGNRVFPASDKAADVVAALMRYMKDCGVATVCGRANGLSIDDGRVCGVLTKTSLFVCSSVIISTGGKSYPSTGSRGDGYAIAEQAGHTVSPLRGSLVPLRAQPGLCSKMQGLSLKNIRLKILDDERKLLFEDFGELLFTHFGISGPLVLSASAHMRDFDNNRYSAHIDLKPALDEKKLDLRILRDFNKYSNRDFSNSLGDLLNKKMIPVIIEHSGIPPGTKVHSISREQRYGLVCLLKDFKVQIDGPRPVDEAIITSGGGELREINPKTMEYKIVPGLYFAGEILNADAYTGGFNLQIAWSTAFAAGSAVG